MRISRLVACGAFIVLAGCSTSSGPRTAVSVDYYDVKGTSFAQVDRQIALHGPNVKGVGNAVASAKIQMIPDISYAQHDGKCYVKKAKVKVRADVTLPRLSDRLKAKKEIQGAFSNIEEYAKLHEAVHVAIADQHAEMAEKKILELPPRNNCSVLRADTVREFEKVMARHRKAQLKFDADEKRRFAKASKS